MLRLRGGLQAPRSRSLRVPAARGRCAQPRRARQALRSGPRCARAPRGTGAAAPSRRMKPCNENVRMSTHSQEGPWRCASRVLNCTCRDQVAVLTKLLVLDTSHLSIAPLDLSIVSSRLALGALGRAAGPGRPPRRRPRRARCSRPSPSRTHFIEGKASNVSQCFKQSFDTNT